MGQLFLFVVVALVVAAIVFGVTVMMSGGDPGLTPVEPDGRSLPLPSDRPLGEEDVFRTRFDTAFSRDQSSKIYVQHRIRELGREVWSWLQEGAYLYLCGDAERMAPDVDAALQVVATPPRPVQSDRRRATQCIAQALRHEDALEAGLAFGWLRVALAGAASAPGASRRGS